MGRLVSGSWVHDDLVASDAQGNFDRPATVFHGVLGSDTFPAVTGRYHLFISHACPWAHRALIFRHLKALTGHISVSVVAPVMGKNGWEFRAPEDSLYGYRYLRDIYLKADPNYTGRVTVPILWDKNSETIVCNESSELIRQFNTAFNEITQNDDDYYPAAHQSAIDRMNAYVYQHINNGVYKCGFAKSQAAYDNAVQGLFEALETFEEHLDLHDYLIGDQITEADWRLFTTLVRFDPVYVTHFKCNKKRLADYPNLLRYARVLYRIPGIPETVSMDHIRQHYYVSHRHLNPQGIIPVGFDSPLES